MNKLTATLMTGVVLSIIAPTVALAKPEHDKKDSGLPPGLQKKIEKGQPLPPGWQKKLRRGDILDYDIFNRGRVVVPLDKDGRFSIQVEDSIIKLDEKTRMILDIVNIITH